MKTTFIAAIYMLLAGQIFADPILLSDFRTVRASASNGTVSYDQTQSPSAPFQDFAGDLSSVMTGVYAIATQNSSIASDLIHADGRIFANVDGMATHPAVAVANVWSDLKVTFSLDESTPYSLVAHNGSIGLGLLEVHLTSASGDVLSFISGPITPLDPTYAGVLDAGTYTLTLSARYGAAVDRGIDNGGVNYALDFGLTHVSDTVSSGALSGMALVGLVALRRRLTKRNSE